MPTYTIYFQTVAAKYLGEIEADSKEEAEELAWEKYAEQCYFNTNIHNDFDLGDGDIQVDEAE